MTLEAPRDDSSMDACCGGAGCAAEDEAPGIIPPGISDEIPDGLINDDLLEERLLKEMQNSLKWVYNHHK